MANQRNRKPKSALNQAPTFKPVEEVPEAKITISGKEFIAKIEQVSVIPIEEPVEIMSTEVPLQEEFDDIEEHEEEVDDIEEHEEEEKPPRTMASLSKAELRWFQRTGMMPK